MCAAQLLLFVSYLFHMEEEDMDDGGMSGVDAAAQEVVLRKILINISSCSSIGCTSINLVLINTIALFS